MQIFETEEEFLAEVQGRVAPDTATPDLAAALRDGVQAAERESLGADPASDGLNLQMGSWAIRDRDLPVLETIGLVGAGVAALLGPGAIVAGAAVARFLSGKLPSSILVVTHPSPASAQRRPCAPAR